MIVALGTDSGSASDPLSTLLGRLCFADWAGGVASFGSSWGLRAPAGSACFYVIRTGDCQLFPSGGSPLRCGPGDFLLLPHGTEHILGDRADSPLTDHSNLSARWPLRDQNPHTSTIVYGRCRLAPHGRDILAQSLPAVLAMSRQSHSALRASEPILQMITEEVTSRRPGWHSLVQHLVKLLFVCTVRAGLSPDETGTRSPNCLLAASDPLLRVPLRLIHEEPGKPWTVPLLAWQAKVSKSAFSERFREMVGQPPMQYLTEIRMHRACELLKESDQSVKQIARLVGYQSPSSFTNTFKRWIGCAPAQYRKKAE